MCGIGFFFSGGETETYWECLVGHGDSVWKFGSFDSYCGNKVPFHLRGCGGLYSRGSTYIMYHVALRTGIGEEMGAKPVDFKL
jgi:hypothetical protein